MATPPTRGIPSELRDASGNITGTDGNPLRTSPASSPGTQPISAASGALTARSGTITLGGTAQQLAAANASRKYLIIQNLSSGDLWFNFAITAVQSQPSKRLEPFAVFVMEGSFVSNQAISIIGATTSQAFAADEG